MPKGLPSWRWGSSPSILALSFIGTSKRQNKQCKTRAPGISLASPRTDRCKHFSMQTMRSPDAQKPTSPGHSMLLASEHSLLLTGMGKLLHALCMPITESRPAGIEMLWVIASAWKSWHKTCWGDGQVTRLPRAFLWPDWVNREAPLGWNSPTQDEEGCFSAQQSGDGCIMHIKHPCFALCAPHH